MSNLLDKLAMGLSEWPNEAPVLEFCLFDIDAEAEHDSASREFVVIKRNMHGDVYLRITESQWQQRRKELINEPDDADAPEWAQWVAQDCLGIWRWYECEPEQFHSSFGAVRSTTACTTKAGKIPAGHDWRKTLRKVERKKITDEVRLGGGFARGGDASGKGLALTYAGEGELIRFGSRLYADALQEAIREAVDLIDVSQDDYVKGTLTAHLKWLLEHQKERIGGKG